MRTKPTALTLKAITALILGAIHIAASAATPLSSKPSTGIPFADGDHVLFLGDSITQDGRYIAFIETYLWAAYPNHSFEIFNMGVSAETVSNTTEPGHRRRPWVHDRVEHALEISNPDWVFICYGMNDGNYYPSRPDIQTAYLKQLGRLLERIEPTGAQIVLLTPPPFDSVSKPSKNLLPPGQDVYGYSKTYELYDDTLIALGALAQGRYGNHVERFIDIHTPLTDYIHNSRRVEPDYRYGDGVHPPTDGHLQFALAILQGLGEDPARCSKLITKATGVTLVGEPSAGGGDPKQQETWKQILSRFNALSKFYRNQTRPETRESFSTASELKKIEPQDPTKLRQRVENLVKP